MESVAPRSRGGGCGARAWRGAPQRVPAVRARPAVRVATRWTSSGVVLSCWHPRCTAGGSCMQGGCGWGGARSTRVGPGRDCTGGGGCLLERLTLESRLGGRRSPLVLLHTQRCGPFFPDVRWHRARQVAEMFVPAHLRASARNGKRLCAVERLGWGPRGTRSAWDSFVTAQSAVNAPRPFVCNRVVSRALQPAPQSVSASHWWLETRQATAPPKTTGGGPPRPQWF